MWDVFRCGFAHGFDHVAGFRRADGHGCGFHRRDGDAHTDRVNIRVFRVALVFVDGDEAALYGPVYLRRTRNGRAAITTSLTVFSAR